VAVIDRRDEGEQQEEGDVNLYVDPSDPGNVERVAHDAAESSQSPARGNGAELVSGFSAFTRW
jgi:hypothetical protein